MLTEIEEEFRKFIEKVYGPGMPADQLREMRVGFYAGVTIGIRKADDARRQFLVKEVVEVRIKDLFDQCKQPYK